MEIFNIILFNPITNALLLFFFVFLTLNIPGAFGWAIVALTVAIRAIMHPFYSRQTQMARKMEEMKPQLDKLTKKYGKDKTKLQQEQLKLYSQMGVNPASGCLLALLQIPIFIGLYRVLLLFLQNDGMDLVVKKVNGVAYVSFLKVSSIDPIFFGFNLVATPSQFQKVGLHYLLIPLVTAILQYFQAKATMPAQKKQTDKEKAKDKPQSFQQAMSSQMRLMFPLMIGYFSFILPVGLSIYWNVFSIFSILQYRKKPKK